MMSSNEHEVDSIFAEAQLIESPEKREAFIRKQCGDDSELRRQVESLLAASERMDTGFMERTATVGGQAAFDPERGSMVGPYKLLEEIGEGGMGTVWMAEQTEPIKRRVAVKLIKAGMDSRQVLARFDAERQALALMDHPNIARVLDAGVTDQGRPYFAMEYVKGIPVNEYCDRSRLSINQRLDLFTEICTAVQHAHQKGIIHRDLKPSNILVCLYDGKPVPKVIDFGLAKAMNQTLTDQTLFTGHGVMLGTPLYMSPEQAEMNNLDIDTRTDIYSLGVILYELLTGSTPLERDQLGKAAVAEILRVIKEVEPPRPSTRLSGSDSLPSVAAQRGIEPARLTRIISGDLDWVIMKALDKDRGRRYASAENLAADIRRHLSDEPVDAGPPTARYRFMKFVRRNRTGVWVASLLGVTLIFGAIGTSSGMIWAMIEKDRAEKAAKSEEEQKNRALDAEEQAKKDANRARIEARTSQAVASLQSDAMAGVGPSVALGRDTTLLEEILDRTIDRIEKELVDEPEVEAKLRSTIGATYLEMGLLDKAKENSQRALELYRKIHQGDHGNIASQLNTLGIVEEFQSEYQEAERLYREAIAMRERLLDATDDDAEGEELRNLATILTYGNEQEVNEARQLLEQAQKKFEQFHNTKEHEDVATVINAFGNLERNLNQYEKAREYYVRALEMHKKTLPANHPYISTDQRNLAGLLSEMGKTDEAEKVLSDAIDTQRNVLGNHPDLAETLWTLSTMLMDVGRLDDAREAVDEALLIAKETFSDENSTVLRYQNTVGQILSEKGDFESALKVYQAILEVDLRIHSDDPESVITTYNNVAFAMKDLGRLDEAEKTFRTALELSKSHRPDGDYQSAMLLQNLARVLSQSNKLEDAQKLYEQSLDIRHRIYGAKHTGIANVLSSLGTIHLKRSELEQAEQKKQRAVDMYSEVLSPDHLYATITRVSLAEVWYYQGRSQEAESVLTDLLPQYEEVYAAEHPRILGLRLMRSRACFQLKQFEHASKELQTILELGEGILPEKEMVEAKYWLGRSLTAMKAFEKAEPMLLQVEKYVGENGDFENFRQLEPISALVDLYSKWHVLAPDAGHDSKAGQWRKSLPANEKK